jgi:hypothetical protein
MDRGIAPEWEYWTPDPEVAELLGGGGAVGWGDLLDGRQDNSGYRLVRRAGARAAGRGGRPPGCGQCRWCTRWFRDKSGVALFCSPRHAALRRAADRLAARGQTWKRFHNLYAVCRPGRENPRPVRVVAEMLGVSESFVRKAARLAGWRRPRRPKAPAAPAPFVRRRKWAAGELARLRELAAAGASIEAAALALGRPYASVQGRAARDGVALAAKSPAHPTGPRGPYRKARGNASTPEVAVA